MQAECLCGASSVRDMVVAINVWTLCGGCDSQTPCNRCKAPRKALCAWIKNSTMKSLSPQSHLNPRNLHYSRSCLFHSGFLLSTVILFIPAALLRHLSAAGVCRLFYIGVQLGVTFLPCGTSLRSRALRSAWTPELFAERRTQRPGEGEEDRASGRESERSATGQLAPLGA